MLEISRSAANNPGGELFKFIVPQMKETNTNGIRFDDAPKNHISIKLFDHFSLPSCRTCLCNICLVQTAQCTFAHFDDDDGAGDDDGDDDANDDGDGAHQKADHPT